MSSRAIHYQNNSFCTELRYAEELAKADKMVQVKNVPELAYYIAAGNVELCNYH